MSNPSTPLVSVAMPVYNAEKYIAETIESVLSQTYHNFELVIVNDASKDNSKQIIQSFNDPRIRYYEHPTNQGIVQTRNDCITYAKGSYIAVLDNDDIALPQRLEKQVAFLESNKNYGVCGSFWQIIDGRGHALGEVEVPTSDFSIRTHLVFNNCFCNSSVMIRSDLIKDDLYPAGFDMIEDFYFLHIAARTHKLANLPYPTIQYRVHGNNTSIGQSGGMKMLRKKLDRIILAEMKIPFNEQELMVHTHFVNGKYDFFNSKDLLTKLEDWLMKLYDFMGASGQYDMKLVRRIMIRRWILVFRHTHNRSSKIVSNRLITKFGLSYFNQFLGMIADKFTKRIITY